MQFRKRFFTVLALLALGWIVLGFLANNAYDAASPAPDSTGGQLGRAVGNSITISLFLCTGLPVLLLSLWMRWRNSVGLANERRRRDEMQQRAEMLDLLKRP